MHDSGNLSDYFLLCECVHGFRVCETHLEIRRIVVSLPNVYNLVLGPLEVQKVPCLYIREYMYLRKQFDRLHGVDSPSRMIRLGE